MIVQHLRKVVPRPEVSSLVNFSARTDSMTLPWVIWTLFSQLRYYNGLKDPKMCRQGTSTNRKHVTVTIPQKLETIRRLESCESQSVVMAAHNVELSTIYDIKKQKDQLRSFMASNERVKELFK